MTLSSIKSFTLELDGPADAAFTGGEVVSGQVVLDLRRDTRVHSMKVQGRGVATAHWLENRGMNSVYNDYTSKITYFRKRQHLIRGHRHRLTQIHLPDNIILTLNTNPLVLSPNKHNWFTECCVVQVVTL
uniref:Arrestin-like N-terminal domain-containing protein n=1 Tax=Lates calcarifer TaxID=8187 RepID=A0A4W6EX63_LATCA